MTQPLRRFRRMYAELKITALNQNETSGFNC
jgi:hypothetical protein